MSLIKRILVVAVGAGTFLFACTVPLGM